VTRPVSHQRSQVQNLSQLPAYRFVLQSPLSHWNAAYRWARQGQTQTHTHTHISAHTHTHTHTHTNTHTQALDIPPPNPPLAVRVDHFTVPRDGPVLEVLIACCLLKFSSICCHSLPCCGCLHPSFVIQCCRNVTHKKEGTYLCVSPTRTDLHPFGFLNKAIDALSCLF